MGIAYAMPIYHSQSFPITLASLFYSELAIIQF